MHKLVEVSLKGKIHLAPISTSPRRILDLGTGTGVWALEMGTQLCDFDSIAKPSLVKRPELIE